MAINKQYVNEKSHLTFFPYSHRSPPTNRMKRDRDVYYILTVAIPDFSWVLGMPLRYLQDRMKINSSLYGVIWLHWVDNLTLCDFMSSLRGADSIEILSSVLTLVLNNNLNINRLTFRQIKIMVLKVWVIFIKNLTDE